MLCKSETLAHQAPQAIARHCVASGFHRHGEADTSVRETIGLDAKSEEAVIDAPAAGIDRIELQLAAQTQFCAET
jgi:hypothetical protein